MNTSLATPYLKMDLNVTLNTYKLCRKLSYLIGFRRGIHSFLKERYSKKTQSTGLSFLPLWSRIVWLSKTYLSDSLLSISQSTTWSYNPVPSAIVNL